MNNIQPKDILISSIATISAIIITITLICLLNPIFNIISLEYRGILKTIFFILSFLILITFVYSNILRSIKTLREQTIPINHNSTEMRIWKQLMYLSEFSTTIFAYITPMMLRPLYYKLLGSKIGKDVQIAGKILEPYLVEMKDYSQAGEMSLITGHIVAEKHITFGKVIIGENVLIGAHSIIMPGVKIGENSIIETNSYVAPFTRIPANELWGGNPAKKIHNIKNQQIQHHKNLNDISKHLKKISIPNNITKNPILDFIKKKLNNKLINTNTQLLNDGIINSLQFFDLINSIEKQFKIEINTQSDDIYKLQKIKNLIKIIKNRN